LAGRAWLDGMLLIYRKLRQLLENVGVKPIETEGQAFDPRFHEAVAHVEGEEGKVISEVQRGYKLHDRVLRPAMVVVGKGRSQESGDRSQESGEEEGKGKKEEGEQKGDYDEWIGSHFPLHLKTTRPVASPLGRAHP